ncbi:CPBP family intramembrane metalloprotease [Staphylococcus equorum]|uniref:CPBP family intramembrane glutamic endopeptidase n=1 Tax=Staphylococcus equorum TaxID=246432 RepID=UPI0025544FB9|nr:CPBP family intramembrane glutamic endopeptidase [Staphylococcus equorum]MDK9847697.1 CPBP family intramembrane metalloprotease [Staphylococcus equorum]
MFGRLKKNIKKTDIQEVLSSVKIIGLIMLPFIILVINESSSYHKDSNLNFWIFGIITSTIITLLAYKNFYMLDNFRLELNNKDFMNVIIGVLILKTGGWFISWLNNFDKPLNQKVWESIWKTEKDHLHYYIVDSSIASPVIEEFIFRGLVFFAVYKSIQQLKRAKFWNFKDKTNNIITATIFLVISSLFFSSVHLSNSFLTMLPYLFAGIVFGLFYIITKNLMITILIHAMNNFTAFNRINETGTYKILISLLIFTFVFWLCKDFRKGKIKV